MKTPDDIAAARFKLEQQLSALDDEEQAWEELTRIQKLAELGHKANCDKEHYGQGACAYLNSNWETPGLSMQKWHKKISDLIALLPDADDEQILKVLRAAS